jgi:hypothetical protein
MPRRAHAAELVVLRALAAREQALEAFAAAVRKRGK